MKWPVTLPTEALKEVFGTDRYVLVHNLEEARKLFPHRGFAVTVSAVSSLSAGVWRPGRGLSDLQLGCNMAQFAHYPAIGTKQHRAAIELAHAGAWTYWVSDEVVAGAPPESPHILLYPRVTMESGRIHNAQGPAVVWPDAPDEYYLEGIRVEPEVVNEPERIPGLFLKTANAEARRVMANHYGHEKLMRRIGKPVQEDEYGKLWRLIFGPAEQSWADISMVEVRNSTPEPDGSRRVYFLRVPPTMRTAKEAVAWSFGMNEKEYEPVVQT